MSSGRVADQSLLEALKNGDGYMPLIRWRQGYRIGDTIIVRTYRAEGHAHITNERDLAIVREYIAGEYSG